MKLIAGIAIGVAAGSIATAGATTARDVYLQNGDRAFPYAGETTCTARRHAGSRLGFVCNVGGDYRARYGVIINEREVAITRYSSFSRFDVVARKLQSPVGAR